MTFRRVFPGRLTGTIRAPPSKSYTHRALVASFLASSKCRIHRPLVSVDTIATREGIARLGARVETGPGSWLVSGPSRGAAAGSRITLDCARSGTTLRFLAAAAATLERETVLTGDPELGRRPIEPLLRVLESGGVRVRRAPDGGSVPLSIRGPLRPVRSQLDASLSSQFLSALLMVLPIVEGDSEIRLVGSFVSRPYVDATLDTMKRARVEVRVNGRSYQIPGGQAYRGGPIRIPGDASSAAYLWAAGAISGGAVRVTEVPSDRPQADLVVLDLLEKMGAKVVRRGRGVLVGAASLKGIDVDLSDAPDLYPLVGTLAAFANGTTRILGAPHVTGKESNRREATWALAREFGALVRSIPNGLAITGTPHPRPVALRGSRDHRVVMSAAVGALGGPRASTIDDADEVAKSFPGFWESLGTLGGISEVSG